MKKLYAMVSDDGVNCPVCGNKLKFCHIGAFCPRKNCWCDGYTELTPAQAARLADKLVKFPK